MFKIKNLFLFCLILLHSGNVFADFLDEQIDAFFSQQFTNVADNITIHYVNQKPQLSCESPALSLTNKNKIWGNVMISAQCGDKKTYIKLNVEVTGNYIVASQPITAGEPIMERNIRLQSGRLDTLPDGVIFKKENIIHYVALRNINSDQPIKSSMIRKTWAIKAGQPTKVIINGEGYQIQTMGNALTNASLGEDVNVRLNSAKIIQGMVTEQGVVIFDKKN